MQDAWPAAVRAAQAHKRPALDVTASRHDGPLQLRSSSFQPEAADRIGDGSEWSTTRVRGTDSFLKLPLSSLVVAPVGYES